MNSFYSTLYGKFAGLQIDQSFSAKLIYPSGNPLPYLKTGMKISDCVVGIPSVSIANRISYGLFAFEDTQFGQSTAVKLAMASACVMSSKSIFCWLYQNNIKEWIASKSDAGKAGFVVNAILDSLAKQAVQHNEGKDFYGDVIGTADMVLAALLSNPKDYSELIQVAIVSHILGIPMPVPTAILKTVKTFMSGLNSLEFSGPQLVEALRDRILPEGNLNADIGKPGWSKFAACADSLYTIITKVPGKWHPAYLAYANSEGKFAPIFQNRLVRGPEFGGIKRRSSTNSNNDPVWQEVFFELGREYKRREKMMGKMSRATKNLNFAGIGFPVCDYIGYYRLYTELAPQIRRIIERVRMIKNVLDENMMEESGNIDLQIAIQAIASESARNDIFTKDENLLKSESWTILVDSSLSLGGSSKQVKMLSICLAEAAREVMGSSPWGMFAFSDQLYCIKDFTEPYDSQTRSRIGGLQQNGLSFIPDAMRACKSLILEYAKDRNYLILVSDGLPSGYTGIDEEFTLAIKELAKAGIDLAAIGVAGTSIKKRIPKARIISEPSEIVKEFMEIYHGLSS